MKKPRIYLFSDMQVSGWDEFVEGETERLIPADAEMVVVNVGSNQELPNVAVIGDTPEEQRAIAGLPIKLSPPSPIIPRRKNAMCPWPCSSTTRKSAVKH